MADIFDQVLSGITSEQEVAASSEESLKPKGGEQNEENQDQSQAYLEGYASRALDSEEQAIYSQGREGGGSLLPSDEGKRQRDDQAGVKQDLFDRVLSGQVDESNAQTQSQQEDIFDRVLSGKGGVSNVQTESQPAPAERSAGAQEGQGLRGEGSSRDKKKVEEGNVPSVASQIIGVATSPFGYIGEEAWKGIAGIARTFGADKVADYATETAARSVEDWATTFGGTPQKEGAGKIAGEVGALAVEAPLMLFTGGAGMAGFLAQGYGGMKEDLRNKYLQEGFSEDEANTKSTTHAALGTAAAIPAYMLAGNIAGKAADKFIAETTPKMMELITRGGVNFAANTAASAVVRGFGAALEGEDIGEAIKNESWTGAAQDLAFAGHATGEWFKNHNNKIEAAKTLPDLILQMSKKSTDRSTRIAADTELKRREAEAEVTLAEQNDLPNTAEVVAKPAPMDVEQELEGDVSKEGEVKIPEEPVKEVTTAEAKPAEPAMADKDARLSEAWDKVSKLQKGTEEHTAAFNDYLKILGEEPVQPKEEVTTKTPVDESAEPAKVSPEEPTEAPRLQEAAVKLTHPETGEQRIFRGGSHDEALTKALRKGFITKDEFKNLFGNKNAANRNTENFGYLDQHLKFHGREEAYKVADEAGQLNTYDFAHYSEGGKPLVHSHEVGLDKYPEKLAGEIPTEQIIGKTPHEALTIASKAEGISKPLKVLIDGVLKRKSPGMLSDTIEMDAREQYASRQVPSEGKPGKIALSSWFQKETSVPVLLHESMHSGLADVVYEHVPVKPDSKISGASYLSMLRQVGSGKTKAPNAVRKAVNAYISTVEQLGLTSEIFGKEDIGKTYGTKGDYQYGLTNIHEFLSEAFTNEKFQSILKNLKGDGEKSIYRNLIEAVRDLFGLPENSMLETVMDAGLSISKLKATKTPEELTLFSMSDTPKKFNDSASIEKMEEKNVKPERAAAVKNSLEGEPPKQGKDTTDFYGDLRKSDLFSDDVAPEANIKSQEEMGKGVDLSDKPILNGYFKFKGLTQSLQECWRTLADSLDGQIIPKLTKYGARISATALAHARGSTNLAIEGIIAQFHPEMHFGGAEYYQFADLQMKNGILGLYDTTIQELGNAKLELNELQDLESQGVAPRGSKKKMDELSEKIRALESQRNVLMGNHDLEKYERDIQSQMSAYEGYADGWRKGYMKKMAEMDEALGATEPTYGVKGRHLDLVIPLVGEKEIQNVEDYLDDNKLPPKIQQVNYRNPDVKVIKAREGYYSEKFSTDLKTQMVAGYASRVNEYQKLMFYKDLESKGAAVIVDPGGSVDSIMGQPVARMEAEMPVKDKETGKVTMRNRWIYVPKETEKEILQLLQVYNQDVSKNTIFNHVTKLQVIGLVDFANHIKFLHTIVQHALGRDSRLSDVTSRIPILGDLNAFREIVSTIKKIKMGDQEATLRLSRIAQTAGIRPKFTKEFDTPHVPEFIKSSVGKAIPEEYLQKASAFFGKFNTHHILLDWDMAVRYILDKRFDELSRRGWVKEYKEGDRTVSLDEQRIEFISRIGEYNNRLQARWIASLRDSGFSPFFVGGSAAMRHSVNMALGRVGFETRGAKNFLESHAYTVGAFALAGMMPAMINLATTGSVMGRPGTPIGAIDFGPAYDTKDGKRRTFDLFQLMGFRRGLRTIGANAYLQGLIDGADNKSIQRNVLNDLWTTTMHPFIGPGPSLAYEIATGKRLDLRSGWQETYDSRNIGGAGQYLENVRVGLKQQNPLLYAAVKPAIEGVMEKGMGIPAPSEMKKPLTLKDMGIKSDTLWGKIGDYFLNIVSEGATTPVTAMVGGKLAVSPALKLSAQLGTKQQYDPQQDRRYIAREQIMEAVRNNDMETAKDLYKKGVIDQILTPSDERILKGKIKNPDILLQRVQRLKSVEDKIKVFRVSTPEEQDRIVRAIEKSIVMSAKRGALTKKGAEETKREFISLAKKGTKLYNLTHPNAQQ